MKGKVRLGSIFVDQEGHKYIVFRCGSNLAWGKHWYTHGEDGWVVWTRTDMFKKVIEVLK